MDFSFITELLNKGGIVMAILMALSVYVIAVIIYKMWQFFISEVNNTSFITEIYEALEDKNAPEAARISGNQKNPIARVIEVALSSVSNKKTPIEKRNRIIEVVATAELRPFEAHLRGLEMTANIAPLLGLLGTVIGMVKAFSNIESAGARVDPSLLAGGIWEALLTTVAGLSVAIPALAAYQIIDSKVEKIRALMKESVSIILTKSES